MGYTMEFYEISKKLDKIIELLESQTVSLKVLDEESRKKINIDSGFICKEDSKDITEALIKITKKLKSEKDTRPLIVERNIEDEIVRDGYLNKDGSIEWVRNYK